MKLYIFRHGETQANVNKFIQGNLDKFGINEHGIQQAEILRDTLSTANLPIIYCSPLSRARQTAKIVASAHDTPLEIVDNLHEVDMGEAEGMFDADAIEKYGPEIFDVFAVDKPETYEKSIAKQETRKQTVERFASAIEYIKNNCPYDAAGVACHAIVMMDYYYHLYSVKRYFTNCDYFVVEI